MFLNTIYEEDFHNFLKNPTDFILSGVVMNENEKGYYYRLRGYHSCTKNGVIENGGSVTDGIYIG